jgi:small subunit ribosomal protein S6
VFLLNTYEVLVIFRPILNVDTVDTAISRFTQSLVQANQGEVVECDRIGRKRMAYPIKKFKDGFLTLFLLKFPPDKIADFRRACQIDEDVLRMTMMRQETLAVREMLKDERSAPEQRGSGRPRRDGGASFGPRRDGGGGFGPRRDGGGGFGPRREGGFPPRQAPHAMERPDASAVATTAAPTDIAEPG